MNCVFCEEIINKKKYVLENDLAVAFYDNFPVSKGHMLFITKRHVKTIFDTTLEEKKALFELIDEGKKMLDKEYMPDGYNIGINCNEVAGQSVMHVHIHLIPRYKGDLENPRGGVRGVIPDKKDY